MSRKPQVKKQLSVKPTSVKPTSVKPTSVKPTSVKPTSVKPTSVKPTSVKPTRTLPFEKGFHFYTDIGNYTGITATSLSEFATKLQIIPTKSISFHFQRKDFQNWIKYTLKDATLAEKISNAKQKQSAEALRKEILGIIKARTAHSLIF